MTDINISVRDNIEVREALEIRKTGGTHSKYKRNEGSPNLDYSLRLLKYGDIDYEAAKILFHVQNRDDDFMNQAAFLCAQAVEKYLKAYLFWSSTDLYPSLSGKEVLNEIKSLKHDLAVILSECIEGGKDFEKFKEQINTLNKYSLLKYPDEEDKLVYSKEGLSISSDILEDVKSIGDFVKGVINEKI